VSLDEGARYARAHRAFGLAPDLAEMEDVGAQLRELRARFAEDEALRSAS
jgi:hypothetical protein